MRIFIKTQAVLVAGSLLDFLVTYFVTDLLGCWYVTGNVAGNLTGCIVQFILSRNWVFTNATHPVPGQLLKFVLMWAGNIALSALGVYLITRNQHQHYLVSKLMMSVLLGVTYTYLLSTRFVFR
jgi:putative flippase GtrA